MADENVTINAFGCTTKEQAIQTPDEIANDILRDWEVDGIPASGIFAPTKDEIRAKIADAIRRERENRNG